MQERTYTMTSAKAARELVTFLKMKHENIEIHSANKIVVCKSEFASATVEKWASKLNLLEKQKLPVYNNRF